MLVKGSRVMAMERVIEALKEYPTTAIGMKSAEPGTLGHSKYPDIEEVQDPGFQTIEGVPPLAVGLRELAAALPSLG